MANFVKEVRECSDAIIELLKLVKLFNKTSELKQPLRNIREDCNRQVELVNKQLLDLQINVNHPNGNSFAVITDCYGVTPERMWLKPLTSRAAAFLMNVSSIAIWGPKDQEILV